MMIQNALVGIGAGAAAALLFASVASGSLLSAMLFWLSPLPLLIAAVGWSHWAAMIGALGGAAALAAALGGVYFLIFLAVAGLPAWWLGYLTMLARPVAPQPGTALSLEWYPTGRLVIWAAFIGAGIVLIAIPNFGTDLESFHAGVREAFQQLLNGESEMQSVNLERLMDFVVAALPPTVAILATITNVLNLWLAARIVKFSGRLRRPWPDIAAMDFPKSLALIFGAAVIVSFLGGLIGILGEVVAASLLMAYGVLGFAVLHAVSRGLNSRPVMLSGAYAVVLIFGWPILALCMLGLAETAAGLRARAARKSRPPTHT
ncbi:MAG TPA: hypothetical protein VFX37_15485 [Pseudolabrys sp.]|nr:hypothetical protein [Pseudolabrys sp.]